MLRSKIFDGRGSARRCPRRGTPRFLGGRRSVALAAWAATLSMAPGPVAAQAEPERTRVVVFGVGHSTQLVARSQQPAVLRAFFDRVAPDVIGIERAPEEFARGDHYEFTYEIQYLAVPYAREKGIPLHPIDWMPPKADLMLGFGVDLEAPPFLRSGWRGFLSFPDSGEIRAPLFFGDAEVDRAARRAPWEAEWEPVSRDLPRRLFWYRTFLQAQRIARAAAEHPGKTLLVQVGVNHKDDIERILASHPRIEIIQPSAFGEPTPAEVEAATRPEDLFAIAGFNLLGVQARTGNVDWPWVREVVARLGRAAATPETRLLATRLAVLTGELDARSAIRAYEQVRAEAGEGRAFTWTGVRDRSRIDSYFDPFGNLSVAQRAMLEIARESYKAGEPSRADAVAEDLAASLNGTMAQQMRGYWDEHVRRTP